MRGFRISSLSAILIPSMIPFAAISHAEPGPRSTVSDKIVVASRSEPKPKAQQTAKKKKRAHRTLIASKKSARKTLNAKDSSGKEKWWLDKSDVGPVQVVVSMEDQHATVYAGGKIVARSNVSTGKRGHTTPTGVFSILQKNRHHRSNIYSNAPMPYMQRLTWSGIALHASKSVPNYPASHGCVRLPNAFAKKLFQFTQKGAHVVIAKTDRSLSSISHPALFQSVQEPTGLVARASLSDADEASTSSANGTATITIGFQATDGPEGRYPSLAKALDIAPKPITETISVASLRLSRTDADEPLITLAPEKSTKPIRVLITRRTGRELIKDVQRLLNQLSYDAGDEDGYMGSDTGAAIKRFQEAEGLPQTGAMSGELVREIYEASGKGVPPMGHIYVRQNFKDVLDAPIGIDNPEKALGTHFFSAQKFKAGEDAPWTVMSLDDKPKSSRFSFMTDLEVDPAAMRARVVLDRLQIPDDVRTRISAILTPGSSLSISDNGISQETGKGTDFVVLTR